MKKIKSLWVLLFFALPVLFISLAAIPEYREYMRSFPEEMVWMATLGNGKTAMALTKNTQDSHQIRLTTLDIGTGTAQTQTLPSSFFQRGFLYPGSSSATLLLPQTSEDTSRTPFLVYSANLDGTLELLDTLYAGVFDQPFFWQGSTLMLGWNEQQELVLDIVKDGILTQAIVEASDPQLVGNIQYASIDSSNPIFPTLKINTFDYQDYVLGLFLDRQGRLPAAKTEDELVALMETYYGEAPMLTLISNQDNSFGIATFQWGDGVSLHGTNLTIDTGQLVPLGQIQLYNPQLTTIYANHLMVSGASSPNPGKATTMVYLYDRQKNELTQLPETMVGSLAPLYFSSSSNTLLSSSHLVLNSASGQAGVILNLSNSQADFVVDSSFPQRSFKYNLRSFILHGAGGPMLGIAGIWLGLLLILLVVFAVARTKRKQMLHHGVQTMASIAKTSATGVTINELPQMELELSFVYDSQPKTLVVKHLLQPGEILLPGMTVAISYNPKNNKAILLSSGELNPDALQDLFNSTLLSQGVTTQHALNLAKNGVKAQGVVLSACPTGKIVNGNAEMKLTLCITKPDGTQQDTTVLKVMPPPALPYATVGRVIDLYYNPDNLEDITFAVPAGSS